MSRSQSPEYAHKCNGAYRDAVLSSSGHFTKANRLHWLSLILLAPISWAERVWALPSLTARALSECYYQQRRLRHKILTDWAWQLLLGAHRWLPDRELVVVGDNAFAALELLLALSRRSVASITQFRLDAALYDPAPPHLPGTKGRPRTKGKRLANLSEVLTDPATVWQRVTMPGWYGGGERTVEISASTAVWRYGGMPVVPIRWVLVRDLSANSTCKPCFAPTGQDPVQVVRWFVQPWQVEVTFREVRDHLGVETQSQWSDKAIARTTPCLLSLFILVILLGKQLTPQVCRTAAISAWYHKQRPAFADTLATVRRDIWREQCFVTSSKAANMKKLRPALRNAITYVLCQAV